MDLTLVERKAKYGFDKSDNILELSTLKMLVKNGENLYTEFKLKANHPEKILKEIVAFANTEGGNLIIGVDDDKTIKGLKFAEEDEFLLINAIEKYCEPTINYTIKNVTLPDSKEILVFEIYKSTLKPHFVKTNLKTNEKTAYIRVADKSIQASKEVCKFLSKQFAVQNIQFTYGDKETKLMHYLDCNPSITVKDYSKIAKIPIWLASKTLVILALASVIRIIPGELTDTFVRNS